MRKALRMKATYSDPADSKPAAPVDLDALMTVEEAAKWLQLHPRILLQNIRLKRIPAMRVNARVIRLHPRSVLAAIK